MQIYLRITLIIQFLVFMYKNIFIYTYIVKEFIFIFIFVSQNYLFHSPDRIILIINILYNNS